MKPAPFEYLVPRTVDAAVACLAELAGADARILAGGQTLVPAMALRLARPSHLVDINEIEELRVVEVEDGALRIGAGVRHSAFHRPDAAGPLGALLSTVVRHIAHLPIRNRGTVCGSLANADPAAEWALVAVTLGATLIARSMRGGREIAARDFFRGFLTTALEPDEILLAARLPMLSPQEVFGFAEFSRRAGDFAQAMALAVFQTDRGRLARVRLGVGGIEAVPRRLPAAERCLEGERLSRDALERAAEQAAAEIQPTEVSDEAIQYKRRLTRAAVLRAFLDAAAPALGASLSSVKQ